MTDAKPNKTANPFHNAGRPAFSQGATRAGKMWAIVTTIAFGVFWFSGLFLAAELFGARELTWTPVILAPVSFIIGVIARIMMSREAT